MRFNRLIYLLPALFVLVAAQLCAIEGETNSATEQLPSTVAVAEVTADEAIAGRLMRILKATEWFERLDVRVDEGIVFLQGVATNEQARTWAANLATKTEDVVAVVNRLDLATPSFWDLEPAWLELRALVSQLIRSLPLMLLALMLLVSSWVAAKQSSRACKFLLKKRLASPLLRDVVARTLSGLVFVAGLYLVLRVSGLSRLALTVIGGTGLFGLAIGFAFRDIAENFLASILISIQNPFARQDLIQVAGHEGYVQSVNMRSTLLMTRDGNHVQVPNATIYKEIIVNLTANPNTRDEFTVGIGYDNSIADAQSIALQVLQQHSAVVQDPEPLVLVDELGAATVNLTAYFWVDIAKYSSLKVRSALIRQVKDAFEQAEISMPDEARERIFPQGVPVQQLSAQHASIDTQPRHEESESQPAHAAEGSLSSDAQEIREQAQRARAPERAESDLLG